MDIVTDLTSRAASFISLMQDLLFRYHSEKIDNEPVIFGRGMPELFRYPALQITAENSGELKEKLLYVLLVDRNDSETKNDYLQHIIEIVWFSEKKVDEHKALTIFSEIVFKLLTWLQENEIEKHFNEHTGICAYPSPNEWREAIRNVLFRNASRFSLVEALEYVPIQIILALGGGQKYGYIQRIYQIGKNDNWTKKYLSETEQGIAELFWTDNIKNKAIDLLSNDRNLYAALSQPPINAPLPFETIFNGELDEIEKSREVRMENNEALKGMERHKNVDPLHRAKKLDLVGVSFSGGGIRSATFNLGVIQSLASNKILKKIDYLSTVSGGGYIGAWLVAWIKRDGAISKVVDRLNPAKSSDPLAEEVRPIRWLRMYSNYLAPDKSLMSTDSWTMGLTWLRNTLINQVVLLLLLCTALSLLPLLMQCWVSCSWAIDTSKWEINTFTCIITAIGALLTGSGMNIYNNSTPVVKLKKSNLLSNLILIWSIFSTFFISAWLYTSAYRCYSFHQKTDILFWPFIEANLGMLIIYAFGRYYKCKPGQHIGWSITASIIISTISLVIGFLLIIFVWNVFELVRFELPQSLYNDKDTIAFVVGVPLILEMFAVTVVFKMALLGNLFPDERREWWGRIGAIVHRFSFFWLLITSTMLILHAFHISWNFITDGHFIALFGGWSAIVGFCVKLAFGKQTSGEKDKPKTGINVAEIIIAIAPYIFGLGSILVGVFLLSYLQHYYKDLLAFILRIAPGLTGKVDKIENWVVFFILFIVTFVLSWRVGVNEFSLHHFYCNRLVRAYLGATRRRTERVKTANPFTGFDSKDDIKLNTFLTKNDYEGPYILINTALNTSVVSTLDRQDRKAESFIFSPLYCGFDVSATRSEASSFEKTYDYGYRKTNEYAIHPDGPCLGTAVAISGAAVNPNMGYHSSAAIAFLLTVFNLRLGWWMGNPRRATYNRSDPRLGIIYLINDLIGKSDTKNQYVCLSDGGHFDNMGIYELVRRRCLKIIVCDAEEDPQFTCEGFANAIKRCRIDFGVEINIDITKITTIDPVTKFSTSHTAEGTIWYPGDKKRTPSGKIIYLKSSITDDETIDIRQYHLENPSFPHQSTEDQFFDESQFESYRKLGYQAADTLTQFLI
jgi:hypothetical protein